MATGTKVKVVWTRSPSIGPEDVAVCGFDFWEDSDSSAASDDQIASEILLWWGNIKTDWTGVTMLREARFYHGYNGDGTPGEVDKIVSFSDAPGTGVGNMLPPQCAFAITEKMDPATAPEPSRRHWGRFYLPAPRQGTTDANGRYTSAFMSNVMAATDAMYDAWATATRHPIIWHREGLSSPGHSFVTSLACDDIVDIIRRRRWETVGIRQTSTVV